jgi:hypothetical protein
LAFVSERFDPHTQPRFTNLEGPEINGATDRSAYPSGNHQHNLIFFLDVNLMDGMRGDFNDSGIVYGISAISKRSDSPEFKECGIELAMDNKLLVLFSEGEFSDSTSSREHLFFKRGGNVAKGFRRRWSLEDTDSHGASILIRRDNRQS